VATAEEIPLESAARLTKDSLTSEIDPVLRRLAAERLNLIEYLKPTDDRINTMGAVPEAFRVFVDTIENWLPPGPDKTYVLRQLRDCANVGQYLHHPAARRLAAMTRAIFDEAVTDPAEG
jgi:hypothetical protein